MAVTEWVAVGGGVQPSRLGAAHGIVVNGGGSGGGTPAPTANDGRIYPAAK